MANIFDKIINKVKEVVAPKMLSPLADHPENMPQLNSANTVMPDGTTANPATKTGYKWSQRYFNPDNSINKNAFITNGTTVKEVTPTPQKVATPTLMPSNMKNMPTPTMMPKMMATTPANVGIARVKRRERVAADFYDACQK